MAVQVPAEIQNSVNTLWPVVRRYLTGWRGVVALATITLLAGLTLGWSWLVAAGIAPILISVLPCLAMCALGLCMHRGGGRSCSAEDTPSKTIDTAPPPRTLDIQPDRPLQSERTLPREGE